MDNDLSGGGAAAAASASASAAGLGKQPCSSRRLPRRRRGWRSRSIRGSDGWRRAACHADRPERRSGCGRAAPARLPAPPRRRLRGSAARQGLAPLSVSVTGASSGPRSRAVSSCANSRNALRSTGLKVGGTLGSAGADGRNGTTLADARRGCCRRPLRLAALRRATGATRLLSAQRPALPVRRAAASSCWRGLPRAGLKPIGCSRRARANWLMRAMSRQTPKPR